MQKNSFLLKLEKKLNNTQKRSKRIRLIESALKNTPNEDTRQALMVWKMCEENPKETRGNPDYRNKKLDHLTEWIIVAEAIKRMDENPSYYSAKRDGGLVSDNLKYDVSIELEIPEETVRKILYAYSEQMTRLRYPAPFREK